MLSMQLDHPFKGNVSVSKIVNIAHQTMFHQVGVYCSLPNCFRSIPGNTDGARRREMKSHIQGEIGRSSRRLSITSFVWIKFPS